MCGGEDRPGLMVEVVAVVSALLSLDMCWEILSPVIVLAVVIVADT